MAAGTGAAEGSAGAGRGRSWVGLLALCLLVVALFEGALLGDDLLVARDLPRQFYPRNDAIGAALAAGEVPRWNPWCGHGAPWFGPRAGGVVYPGHLLFAALSPGRAMAWFIALHTALALAGAWRLGRHDAPGDPTGPWLVGLAYGLGGFVTSMHWALPYLVSSAWLPWALVGARQAAAGERRGLALVGAAVGLCLLAAEPQGALIVAALAATSALAHAPGARRLAAPLLVGAAVVVGAAAGGLTLESVRDELPRLDRGAGGWSELRFPLHPLAQLVDALVPGVHGHWAQHTGGFWGVRAWAVSGKAGDMPWCGLGVGALGLAAVAASGAAWRRPAWQEAAAWVVLGVALAAVDAGAPLHLRYPSKWLVITALGLARLVGLGAPGLLRAPWPPAALAAFGLPAGLLGLWVLVGGEAVEAWLDAQAPGYVLRDEARAVTSFALLRAGAAALVAVWACLLARRWPGRRGRALLVGALALDLLTAARPGVLTLDGAAAPVLDAPPLVAALRARAAARGPDLALAPPRYEPKDVFYRHEFPPLAHAERDLLDRDALRPNIGYRFGVRTVIAFESAEPRGLSLLQRDPRWKALPLLPRYALLDADVVLVDLRRDAHALGLPPGRVEVVAPVGPQDEVMALAAVANPWCPPWAYLIDAAVGAPDLQVAATRLLDPRAGPAARVVLGPEGADQAPPIAPPGVRLAGGVRLVAFEAERVALEVAAPRDAWLVVREAWAPDWQATVDGAPAPLARADLLFRAVRVPAGRHEVVLTHAPAWWARGLALTALGWAAIAALALLRPAPHGPPAR